MYAIFKLNHLYAKKIEYLVYIFKDKTTVIIKMCDYLIEAFLHSTMNEDFIIQYKHIEKIDLENAFGNFRGVRCKMNDNDYKKLDQNEDKYTTYIYNDTIYLNSIEYIVPSIIKLNNYVER